MHMLLTIVGGVVLFGCFALFGKLWGGDVASVVLGGKWFIPTWLVISLVNMWVGVTHAGYSVQDELPILLVVFAVPAALAAVAIWRMQ